MKPQSLQTRLILGAIVWIALGLSMASISISDNLSEHVLEWVDAELSGHLTELMGLVDLDDRGKPVLRQSLSDPRFNQTDSKFYWQVTLDRRPILKSPSLGDKILPLLGRGAESPTTHKILSRETDGPVLELARNRTEDANDPIQFQVGVDQGFVDEIMGHFKRAMNASFVALGLILTAAAFLQIKFGLRPLVQLRSELAKIKTGRNSRLPQTFPTEVQPLIHDLNGMIDANGQIVQKARLQAGNLAHGLKTPLAVLNDEADRLKMRGQTEAAEIILQQCQVMERQINYQLARARAAAMSAVPGITTEVQSTLSAILSALGRLYPHVQLQMKAPIPATRTVLCDPMDFNEMVGNILDNACKWAKHRVLIDYYTSKTDGQLHLLIEDDGPGLLPEQVGLVFQVGEKLDERVPGAGLGLPIVRDLADQYGGSITLRRGGLGGLSADLALPAPPEED